MKWNDLSMAERTAYIKLGLDNGITDLNTIRDVYNEYANGGPIKKKSTDSSNFNSLLQETVQIPINIVDIEPIMKEDDGVVPKTISTAPKEQWINPNTSKTPTRVAFTNYLNSPVVKKRLDKMYAGYAAKNAMTTREYSDMVLQDMQQTNSDVKVVIGDSTHANLNQRTITIGGEVSPGLSHSRSGTLSHELGHLMYPSGDDNWGLTGVNATYSKAKKIYGNTYDDDEYDAVISHDNDMIEKIPFVYETREDMRKLGIWDYTSGEDITPEQYKQYKDTHPQNRLGNYTDDTNAVNLLNTIAYNPVEQYSYFTSNIAANGGSINNDKSSSTFNKRTLILTAPHTFGDRKYRKYSKFTKG